MFQSECPLTKRCLAGVSASIRPPEWIALPAVWPCHSVNLGQIYVHVGLLPHQIWLHVPSKPCGVGEVLSDPTARPLLFGGEGQSTRWHHPDRKICLTPPSEHPLYWWGMLHSPVRERSETTLYRNHKQSSGYCLATVTMAHPLTTMAKCLDQEWARERVLAGDGLTPVWESSKDPKENLVLVVRKEKHRKFRIRESGISAYSVLCAQMAKALLVEGLHSQPGNKRENFLWNDMNHESMCWTKLQMNYRAITSS